MHGIAACTVARRSNARLSIGNMPRMLAGTRLSSSAIVTGTLLHTWSSVTLENTLVLPSTVAFTGATGAAKSRTRSSADRYWRRRARVSTSPPPPPPPAAAPSLPPASAALKISSSLVTARFA